MKVFHWNNVKTMSQWLDGDVIVMAETVEQARVKALTDFVAWVETEDSYFNYMVSLRGTQWWHEEDEEEYQKLIEKFKVDIAKEPLERQDAIFIMGSE